MLLFILALTVVSLYFFICSKYLIIIFNNILININSSFVMFIKIIFINTIIFGNLNSGKA